MLATLTVPVMGTRAERISQSQSTESITLVTQVKRGRVMRNDHNHADECEITLDWTEVGVDPRMLDHGVVAFYIANADEFGQWQPSNANCRFIGIIDDIERNAALEEPLSVTLHSLDYTDLFLRAKPFGSSGIPLYSETLEDAWRRVVSQTPGADILADRLRLEGIEGSVVLGQAVAERFRKLARVPTHPETDAWAVWQQCVGMLGLISYIDRDECVVTTATNYYTEGRPPRLVWGQSLTSLVEHRRTQTAGKGIGLTSFDPLSGTTIEAFYPPVGDERVNRKRAKAGKAGSEAAMRQAEDREYFPYPGVTDVGMLEQVAQRVWEERSRQELEGSARTSEMEAEIVGEPGQRFDLLNLKTGDSVRIEFSPQDRQILARLPTDGARVRYLHQRGFTEEAAALLVKNWAEFSKLEPTFLTRNVTIEFDVDEDGGTFSIDLQFINRIQPSGDTDDS